ncbi:hypothetical protein [Arthrobacter celericrescens]|uniref:hypothetical protein n=1 Tax=Arthrobacter celericrescens TaxID=2320851 RepID=UPI0013C50CB7|nr:hypothetical protein [Arthrobacter celericrescens]
MESGPRDLTELRRAGDAHPSWFLDLVQPEIGGGRLDVSLLSKIDANPRATALRVSGLNQSSFERLVSDHGSQFKEIEFWKCPKLQDLTPLEDLPDLRMVSIFWNQRATRLWDLARTPRLSALRIDDFTRLHQLDDLYAGQTLKELIVGDAVWDKSTFETLEPLGTLRNLLNLSLLPKRIDDGRVQPLGSLTNLKTLRIPYNLFTTEQLAWLRAHLPEAVESDALAAVLPLKPPLHVGGKPRDVLLIGKRKPFLNSELDAARIRKHELGFQEMVAAFRGDPSLSPK